LFVPQAHEMRKGDFSDHAFSVFLVSHCLAPLAYCSSGAPPETALGNQLPLIAKRVHSGHME
jgi:hypothetical protein